MRANRPLVQEALKIRRLHPIQTLNHKSNPKRPFLIGEGGTIYYCISIINSLGREGRDRLLFVDRFQQQKCSHKA